MLIFDFLVSSGESMPGCQGLSLGLDLNEVESLGLSEHSEEAAPGSSSEFGLGFQ